MNIAIGMDIRDDTFVKEFPELKKMLSKKLSVDVLFLTADHEVVVTRYSTTRRRHPLQESSNSLLQALAKEREILEPIKKVADGAFDTSYWTPHALARQIEQRYEKVMAGRSLLVSFTSFGFKNGPFRSADCLFDVRFLKNPYFNKELKEKTGVSKDVRDYVFSDSRAEAFGEHVLNYLKFSIPEYYSEGKHYLRVGIGCTGGKHRSVALSEYLSQSLTDLNLPHVDVVVTHRDL